MAVRTEKEQNGRMAIVIDGFEKGIANSPYSGIASLKNVNINFLEGATYVNYKRLATTITGGTMARPKYWCQSPGASPTYYVLDDKGQVWSGTSTTFTLLTGNHTASSGLGQGIAYFKNYLFVFGTDYVEVCGNGTGVGGITSGNWVSINSSGYYFKNLTSVSITGAPVLNATSVTLSSSWAYASGTYQISIGNGAQLLAGTLTKGSTTVSLVPAINVTTAVTTIDIALFPTSGAEKMSIVAINDYLYFCNGSKIGSINAPAGTIFDVTNFSTMTVNYGALVLKATDTAVWLEELRGQLAILVQNYFYLWDKLSTVVNGLPINENPSKMINILNTIYIFAGQKGNIYQTAGTSISLFKKIPDSFIGVIDPSWIIGGLMFHRNKLCFGACGFSVSSPSTNTSGIFSVDLTTEAINFEAQNSYGISATTVADGTNVLIDANAATATAVGSGVSYDTFYTAWYNNSVGGMDYNDNTLWQNYEPAIETDLIPVGTFLEARTFENVEYKLDKALANGDSIRLSYRTSFSGSYTVVGISAVTGAAGGTTTATSSTATQVLSDTFDSEIQTAQWVQLKVEFKCASSSSSFIRLREIRLH